jgi:hypothetical protein
VGVSLIIDLNKKKGKKRGGVNFVMDRQFKEKNKNLLRLKHKSAFIIEQISVVL